MKGKKGSRILLVEDNLSQAELIKGEVEKAGFDSKGLVHAISGERGLEILQKEAFDMVLLDCSLPAMDGAELLKRMREIHVDIPLIVISGQGSEKVAVKAMRIGSRNYILESWGSPTRRSKITSSGEDSRLIRRRGDIIASAGKTSCT